MGIYQSRNGITDSAEEPVFFIWDVVTSALGLVVSVGIKRVYEPGNGNILLQVFADALSPEHLGLFIAFLLASIVVWTVLQCIPHHFARTIREMWDNRPLDEAGRELLDRVFNEAETIDLTEEDR